ncbi:ROK family transcriptional regulator [Brachybacterium fresconis]|uniref:NBD/HSP70 family sugar kinase n=1 Tax=Brachybacterium fresconis TaxID=173363 RepID=A0ABS4YLY5_9MICO|nr:ROK family transcriptional regulator [Brachybacterium fresconis]MBP2409793.1 putative NBD/HSP70 family sugar kinase [Brachybacterium fresconis]
MQSTHLREHNLSVVMRAVATATEPISRATLARSTQLTKPTVSKLVEELISAGLVEEHAPVSQGSGRPMVPLQPAKGTVLGIGLEIAAEHISCLGIDLAGRQLSSHTEYLRVDADTVEETARACARLVEQVRADAPRATLVGVCAAVPGRMSPDGQSVLAAPNLDWTEVPLGRELARTPQLDGVPVQVHNDIRLSVLTEIARRPEQSFMYVRGSTGVGGAIVLDGTVLDGVHGWAGEFGHTVVEPGGALCRCGRRGCLEAYISYHALRERAGLRTDVLIDELVEELSRSTDRAEVIGTIGRSLGLALANALNILDLSTVVLSGYLGPIAGEIAPFIRETVERHALAAEVDEVVIERSDDLEAPALWGAARAAIGPILDSPGAWIARTAEMAG